MIELIFAGTVPERLKTKAESLANTYELRCGLGWKKVRGLRDCFSFRLNNNYRVLHSQQGHFWVCNHDIYEKKIRNLKRLEA